MRRGSVPGVPGEMTRLVQGTVMLSPDRKDEDFSVLDAVHEAGIRAYDSSHIYGDGGSDSLPALSSSIRAEEYVAW